MILKAFFDMNSHENLLNIAASVPATRVLGPGLRAGLWVQGCPHRCAGCVAPEWWGFSENRLIQPSNLLPELLTQPVQGLTISGGEPMLQAAGLARLIQLARQQRSLDVICYTGFYYADLVSLNNPGISSLLAEIDVLIDGPYVAALDDQCGLRGSSNQHIIHLSDRLKAYDFETLNRKVEIVVSDGEMFMIGLPDTPMHRAFKTISFSIDALSTKIAATQ